MTEPALDDLPGFRRRLAVTPAPGCVRSEVEDDYHGMVVVLHHDGQVALSVVADMARAPWTTCPGAPAVLERTFTGVRLDAFAARGDKLSNCTHLHDLAVLAAAHAHDETRLIYDILVCDPVEGRRRAELRRNGRPVLGWSLVDGVIVEPAILAGVGLDKLRPWIDSLDAAGQEQARLLRWGTILAHGRHRSYAGAPDAAKLPIGQCYTFQPERAPLARHIGETVLDFSAGPPPLARYGDGAANP